MKQTMSTMKHISEQLLQALWQLDPVNATNMGVSGFEGMLPPVDPDERQHLFAQISELTKQLKQCRQQGFECLRTPGR